MKPTPNGNVHISDAITPITHQFRLPRYHHLLSSNIKQDIIISILGVTTPVIHKANYAVIANGTDEATVLLMKAKSQSTLERTPIIEGHIPQSMQLDANSLVDQRTNITEDSSHWQVQSFNPSRIAIDVTFDQKGILIYADNIDDSWEVFVVQIKDNILIANLTNKAVIVEKGYHLVEFVYRPKLYIVSFWLRAISVGLAIIYCAIQIFLMLTRKHPCNTSTS